MKYRNESATGLAGGLLPGLLKAARIRSLESVCNYLSRNLIVLWLYTTLGKYQKHSTEIFRAVKLIYLLNIRSLIVPQECGPLGISQSKCRNGNKDI